MPRPNKPRSLAEEANLGRRIAYERERRGWTYDGLASRMTTAGCPINASALYKIEKADPPRRITVAEHVALSQVFEIPMTELLLPPEVAAVAGAAELIEKWRSSLAALRQAQDAAIAAGGDIAAYAKAHPKVTAYVEQQIRENDDILSFIQATKNRVFQRFTGGVTSNGEHQEEA